MKARRASVDGRRWVAFLLSLALLAGWVAWPDASWPVRSAVFSWFSRLRGPEAASDRVVVVTVDSGSLRRWGAWPWEARLVELLLRRLASAEPAALAVDLDLEGAFSDPDKSRLSSALQGAPVVLETAFQAGPTPSFFPLNMPRAQEDSLITPPSGVAAIRGFPEMRAPSRRLYAWPPNVTFAFEPHGAAAGGGFSLFARMRERLIPALPVEAVRRALGVSLDQVRFIENSGALLGPELVLAINARAEIVPGFLGPAGSLPTIPAGDILSGRFPVSELKGRIVFLGESHAGARRLESPFEPRLSEVELKATVATNLLQRNGYLEPSWSRALSVALAVVFSGAMLAAMAARLAAVPSALLVAALLLLYPVVSFLVFRTSRWWLPPQLPALATASVFLPRLLVFVVAGRARPRAAETRMAAGPSAGEPPPAASPSAGEPPPAESRSGVEPPLAPGPAGMRSGQGPSPASHPFLSGSAAAAALEAAPPPRKAMPDARPEPEPRPRPPDQADPVHPRVLQPQAGFGEATTVLRSAMGPPGPDTSQGMAAPGSMEALGRTETPGREPPPSRATPRGRPAAFSLDVGEEGPQIIRDEQGLLIQLGKYRLLRRLASGGGGQVYEGLDTSMGRKVAIKTLAQDADLRISRMADRFAVEARAAGSLSHPHINTIYDFGRIRDVTFLVLEFLDGRTLSQWMKENPTPPPEAIMPWLEQICDALDYAHGRHIIHRDLKPGNLMLVNRDQAIKLLDFGIAKVEDMMLTQTGVAVGTPIYMSPEQFTGEKIGPASDQYALSVVVYQLLSYKLPYEGTRIPELCSRIVKNELIPLTEQASHVSLWFWESLRRGLSRSPSERYENCTALYRALKACT